MEKNKERLKLEQGDDDVKDSQITRLIEMERVVRRCRQPTCQGVRCVVRVHVKGIRKMNRRTFCIVIERNIGENSVGPTG